MAENYSALSGGSAATNGGLGGGQYSSANNVGTFTPSNYEKRYTICVGHSIFFYKNECPKL
jgi:hypothetical protein